MNIKILHYLVLTLGDSLLYNYGVRQSYTKNPKGEKMKKLFLIGMFLMGVIELSFADVYVHSYFRSDGTYVASHYRSNPDDNIQNNWSTMGNTNPYTGKRGYKNPYSW